MLRRIKSANDISTFMANSLTVLETDSDHDSIFSDETLDAAATPIFRNRILSYTRLRELPVVTSTLKSELCLFSSTAALENGGLPLLSVQLNKFHFIKKNAPFLTTFIHDNGMKQEYCRVFFKILQNNLTCYVFMYSSGKNLILLNNALKPHSDGVYKNTKLRAHGVSGAASTFGSSAIKLYLLDDSSSSLVDGMDEKSLSGMTTIKDLSISESHKSSELYRAVISQKRNEVLRILALSKFIAPVPFATFFDHGGDKIDGIKVLGTIRLFESTTESDASIPDDTLTLSTLMLTLVEQELLKMRGHKKPSLVNFNSS